MIIPCFICFCECFVDVLSVVFYYRRSALSFDIRCLGELCLMFFWGFAMRAAMIITIFVIPFGFGEKLGLGELFQDLLWRLKCVSGRRMNYFIGIAMGN